MTRNSLVLVERTEHVPEAIRLKRLNPVTVRLLALSPGVMQAFRTVNVPFQIPEDFVSPETLTQRGRETYLQLEHLGVWFETTLRDVPEPLRVNPVFLHFYQLKLLIDSVSLRIMELATVFRAEPSESIIVLSSPGDPLWATPKDQTFLVPDGPIYAAVAPLVAEAIGLGWEVRQVRTHQCLSRWINEGWRLVQQGFHTWVSAIRDLWRLSFSWRLKRNGRPILWQVAEPAHDISGLIEILSQRLTVLQWGPTWGRLSRSWLSRLLGGRPVPQLKAALEALWSGHRTTISDHPIFTAAGIHYFSLLEPFLHHLLVVEHLEASRIFGLARYLIHRRRPSAVLMISSAYYEDTILSLASRAEGVPVIYAQEGGLYGYCHCAMYHYRELALSDYVVAYGPGVADYLNTTRLTPRQRSYALPIGAIRLQRLRALAGEHTQPVQRVMYIPTTEFHHGLRYAPLNYSDRQYAQMKRQILETLLTLPGTQIVYKPVTGTLREDSLREFLAQHKGRVEVCDRPLPMVLDEADAFVLDWPTTSLLEVLTTRKPVAVLMDRDVTEPVESALSLLRRRARVNLDLPSFLSDLCQGFSETVNANENLDDTSFLEAYGTGGASAWDRDRLVAFFESLGQRPQAWGPTDHRLDVEPCLAEQGAGIGSSI